MTSRLNAILEKLNLKLLAPKANGQNPFTLTGAVLRVAPTALLLCATAPSLPAHAQTTGAAAAGIEFSGLIDVYHQYNTNGQPTSGGRIFDAVNNQTSLQWAELSARKKAGPVGARVDLAFGQQADALAGIATATPTSIFEPTRNIAQAFLTYTPTVLDRLTVTAGKFYAFAGYEVPRAKDNWNYSRSLSFNWAGPFWHQGVSVGYKFVPDKLSGTFHVVNGWDGRLGAETNKSQTYGLNVNAVPIPDFILNFNVMSGPETGSATAIRNLYDVNATWAITPLVSIAADVVLGTQKEYLNAASQTVDAQWLGWALYARVAPVDNFAFAFRYENYDDRDGASLSGFATGASALPGLKISSYTATASYLFDANLEGRLEWRMDKADKNSKLYKDSNGADTDSENTAAIALLASF